MQDKFFSVVDIEVTEKKEIVQIAIINLDKKLNILDKVNYYFKPNKELSSFLTNLTGITNEQLEDKPSFRELAHEIYNMIKNNILVCHGVIQDYSILKKNFVKEGISYNPFLMLDTVELTKLYFPTLSSYKLGDIAESLELIALGNYHNAAVDVDLTVQLLQKIVYKINSIQEKNFIKIKSLLKKYNKTITMFSEYYRLNRTQIKTSNLLLRNNLYFRKIESNDRVSKASRQIFLSSIDEDQFIKCNNLRSTDKTIAILHSQENYIPFNFFNIFKKKLALFENNSSYSLLIKLIVWIQETKTGNFNELTLDLSEFYRLTELKKYFNKDVNYYYEKALNKSLNSDYIITNYNNLTSILMNDYLNNDTFVYEDKNILGVQVKRLCKSILYYKDVVIELNVVINKTRNNVVVGIQKNIEDLVKYLHEMYIFESLELYNEAIEFIINDIEYLISELSKLNVILIKTNNFLNNLLNILKDKTKGYYRFESIHNNISMILKIKDSKKEKLLINKIYSNGNIKFLEDIINIDNFRKKFQILSNDSIVPDFNLKKIYLFNSSKYKELYYTNRDKKTKIKFKKYSLDDDFSNLFRDVMKNNKLGYVCYANMEILAYKMYLSLIFDEIITLKDVEY